VDVLVGGALSIISSTIVASFWGRRQVRWIVVAASLQMRGRGVHQRVVNEPNQEVKMLPQLTLHLIEKLRQTQEVKRVSEQNHSQEKKNKDAYRP